MSSLADGPFPGARSGAPGLAGGWPIEAVGATSIVSPADLPLPATSAGLPFGASSFAVLTACSPTWERCRNGARRPAIRTASVAAIATATPSRTERL